GRPCAPLIVADPSGAGPGQRVDQPFDIAVRHEDDELVQRLRPGRKRPNVSQIEPGSERIGYTGLGHVRVRVRHEVRYAVADHAMDERTFRIGSWHAVDSTEQEGMVRDEQLRR